MKDTNIGQPHLPVRCANLDELDKLILVPKQPGDANSREDRLSYENFSVKRRLEDSAWFGNQVLKLRGEGKTGWDVVRDHTAFVFFARSVVDLEVFFVNDLCGLGLGQRLKKALPSLHEIWENAFQSAWFRDLDKTRNYLAHRLMRQPWLVHQAGGPTGLSLPPVRKNLHVAPGRHEYDVESFVRDKLRGVNDFTEQVAAKLVCLIRSGAIKTECG